MDIATKSRQNLRSSAIYQARSHFRGVEQNKAFFRVHTGCIAFQEIALQIQQHCQQTKLPGEHNFGIAVMYSCPQTLATYKSSGALVKVSTFIIPALDDSPG